MSFQKLAPCVCIALLGYSVASATEPNETFSTSTHLAHGVLTVEDSLTSGGGSSPDTLLGIRDLFGSIYHVDDDGSPVGDGSASGVGNVPTNSGSIHFSVTGYPDEFFVGSHSESGDYKVYITAYDFFGDEADRFSERRTLEPGVVHDFSYSDFNWLNGTYDVYIDNATGGASSADVDFFTFTGLTAGSDFTARTAAPGPTGIDTYLGWFNDNGTLVEADNDGAGGVLSLIEGTVPASGNLPFAVTGYEDSNFTGTHAEIGDYQLTIEVTDPILRGDYNGDGTVNLKDYTVWRDNLGSTQELPGDTTPGMVTAADYAAWKSNFATSSALTTGSAARAVPEPTAAFQIYVVCVAAVIAGSQTRRQL